MFSLEHMKLHEEHKGHEQMHLEMFLILVVVLIISQFILIKWRQRHLKSFQLATLCGMWLVPVIISFYNIWTRFIVIWSIFSLITAFMAYSATRKPMSMSTPRYVGEFIDDMCGDVGKWLWGDSSNIRLRGCLKA